MRADAEPRPAQPQLSPPLPRLPDQASSRRNIHDFLNLIWRRELEEIKRDGENSQKES